MKIPTKPRRKSKKKVADILNSATSVKGIHKIGKMAEASNETVLQVLKDFPLWDYVRKRL